MSSREERTLAELQPYIERARSFSGWSFGDVRSRQLGDGPPWDYEALVREHVRDASSVVDLGTGGGEFFARVVPDVRGRAVATEEWHVNAPIARRLLAPLGADVVRADSLRLPFRAATFDAIIDRHEAIDPSEVVRVMAPGGVFVTQQVDSTDWQELGRYFPRKAEFGDHFVTYRQEFRDAGLAVEAQRWSGRIAYETLGDIVYMLLVAPWEIPAFDPKRDIEALLALEDGLRTDDGIVLTMSRYLIVARKPA